MTDCVEVIESLVGRRITEATLTPGSDWLGPNGSDGRLLLGLDDGRTIAVDGVWRNDDGTAIRVSDVTAE